MDCPGPEWVENYVLGRLKDPRQTQFEGHLKTCAACRAKLADAKENEKLLAELRTFEKDRRQSRERHDLAVETTDRAQSLLGDRYRVVRKVGDGFAGCVFQAVDTVLERLVAIKFLPKKSPTDTRDPQSWREARLMSQLNHPNVAQVYEIGRRDGQRFIVMEWVDGLPLTDVWKELQIRQRLRIYLGLLDAVAAAHRRGIIHRDIKPSNVLVTSDLKPKVLDFGIAVQNLSLESIEHGLYRGTPAYSAPEQISPPVKLSPATDVFALGVLLYQLLTDSLPFPQTDVRKLFDAIKNDYPELPSAVQENTPVPLQNICLKALEKDPQNRYPDAQGLSDDINRYLRGEKVWSRPSFLTDKIRQEVFYHRQKLKVWHDNELITQKEFDKLENIYERMISPPDPSIIEARKLSGSQVCLYLGGWVAVLGSFVLFYKTWDHVPVYWRPAPAIAAAALMSVFGIAMWLKRESRLSVGFLATANLLIPITILLTLGQWQLISAAVYPWGTESVFDRLTEAGSHVIVGNLQLFVSSCCWLGFSIVFLWLTRSSIFVLFSIIAFLAVLTTSYIIAGMEHWQADLIAGRYLFPGIGMFAAGATLDQLRRTKYAWPPCAVGLLLIAIPLSAIALSDNTLFGWLYRKPAFLAETENRLLSFVSNGVVYLALAGACRLLGTRLQRTLAQVFNWLGPLHVLATLRILDSSAYELPEAHRLVYRFLLPAASLAFVFASVARQMKSFFFSGLAGIAAAVHRFTTEHLDKYFAWPVSLIITGVGWMFVSWLVPRWKARYKLKRRESSP
ncbi:MAG: protein kinase domain-containing protein [Planctomycetota bacterium]|jgi:serine/threonine-protein kinase